MQFLGSLRLTGMQLSPFEGFEQFDASNWIGGSIQESALPDPPRTPMNRLLKALVAKAIATIVVATGTAVLVGAGAPEEQGTNVGTAASSTSQNDSANASGVNSSTSNFSPKARSSVNRAALTGRGSAAHAWLQSTVAASTTSTLFAGPDIIDAVLDENVQRWLGAYGMNRLYAFSALPQRWNAGRASPLRTLSLCSFGQFFENDFLKPKSINLFMTDDGNLVANWLRSSGSTVEIEFRGEELHYFDEGSNQEYAVALRDADEFRVAIAGDSV